MAYVSDSNLTQFWGLAKGYIKAEDSRYANWQKTEKAGAVTCWPVGGTELLPTVDVLFTETPPASGDKSPSNPSIIKGVDSVFIRRTGINFLTLPYRSFMTNTVGTTYVNAGVTYTYEGNGIIRANGTATGGTSYFSLNCYSNEPMPSTPGTYTVIAPKTKSGTDSIPLCCYTYKNGQQFQYTGTYTVNKTVTVNSDNDGIWFYYKINSGTTVNNVLLYPQVFYEGNTENDFSIAEEFKITISLGSTYYGGSIDLATGLMTVTWEGLSFNGSENIFFLGSVGTSGQRLSVNMNTWYPDKLPLGGAGNSVSSHFDFYSNDSAPFGKYSIRADGYLVINDSAGIIGSTVEEYKTWLASEYNAGHPVSFSYKLRTPYTVQLSPTEILSLSQTDKYTPRLNTVYTDAQSVQVGYAKSPIRSEYELTQAIIATEGGE